MMGFRDMSGKTVPQDIEITNYDGRTLTTGQIFSSGRPVIVLPQFYNCMGVCLAERESMAKVLSKLRVKDKDGNNHMVGRDFDVLIFGIDPNETAKDSSQEAKNFLEIYNKPDWNKVKERGISDDERARRQADADLAATRASNGMYFTTCNSIDTIRRFTDALGFIFYYDPASKLINHPAGGMILTPDGVVSDYLYGTDFATVLVKDGLASASKGQLTKAGEPILLGCIMMDKKTGKRTVVIRNVLNVMCVFTVLSLAGWITTMTIKTKAREAAEQHEEISA